MSDAQIILLIFGNGRRVKRVESAVVKPVGVRDVVPS